MKKILIAGGTGFVGQHLISYLLEKGLEIVILSRQALNSYDKITYYKWDIEKGFIDKKAFEGVDTIINLAGANIGEKRWTEMRKKELLNSRVKSIDLLYKYVIENDFPIKTFISSSAVGYYGAINTDKIFKEEDTPANDFLGSLCTKWENAAQQFKNIGVRVIILRKGIVMGKGSAFYQKLSPLAKIGINPALGTGKQFVPWIDIKDLVRLYEFIIFNHEISGNFNAVASQHLTINELASQLLNSFEKKKIITNAPAFLIKMFFGEMANMLLYGSRVSNEKIIEQGFKFSVDTIDKSL